MLLTPIIHVFSNFTSSWMDRIPFVLLFGIATSVELFHERLSRSASRCLSGTQFDVEQTSSILENVFLKVVAGAKAPLRLGPVFVSSLMERQHNHVQSIQAFVSTLKVRAQQWIFYLSMHAYKSSTHTCVISMRTR